MRMNIKRIIAMMVVGLTVIAGGIVGGTTPAVASTNINCLGYQPNLSNNTPTQACKVMGPQITANNLPPAIALRGYGLCVLVSEAWVGSYNPGWAQEAGDVTASLRVVYDNGSCTGATQPGLVDIVVVPSFHNVYGVGGSYGQTCYVHNNSYSGAVTAHGYGQSCAPHTIAGVFDDWQAGDDSMVFVLNTPNVVNYAFELHHTIYA